MNRIFPRNTAGPAGPVEFGTPAEHSLTAPASEPDIVANLRGVLEPSRPTGEASPEPVVARWRLPQPFEPSYAYPALVHICGTESEWAATDLWAERIGLQNVAILNIRVPASDPDADVGEPQPLRIAMGAAWLRKPAELTIREDRVYGLAQGATALPVVHDWLAGSPWFAGVAAISPTQPPAIPAGLARIDGRLLVTGVSDWSRTASTLYAAGADAELRPQARDIVTAAGLVNAWMLRAIPSAVGV